MSRATIAFCDECGRSSVELIDESLLVTMSKRKWPMIYHCKVCHALVGCHPGTTKPLGYMANKRTRAMRAQLHELIDPIWQSGLATRTEMYAWLSKELKISYDVCHFSQLRTGHLIKAIALAQRYYDLNSARIQQVNKHDRQQKNRR